MKKIMMMAAAVIISLAANAQTIKEAKATVGKAKTYADAVTAFKAGQFDDAGTAFCYNKIAELAAKESVAAEEAALKAQLAKDETGAATFAKTKNELALAAIENAKEAYKLDPKAVKVLDKLQTLRNSLVNAGLDAYNTKDYASAEKYFGVYTTARTEPLFSKIDFTQETNYGQIAYYAALAAYFNKDGKNCSVYADIALDSNDKEILNDVITVKLGALELQAQAQAIDTASYINEVKKVYEKFPENEGVFAKLVGLCDDSGQKETSKALLDERLAKNPNDAMANAFIAQSAQADGKYAEAIVAYTKAISAKPDFLAAKMNLGVCYLNQAAANIDANTDARGIVKPDVKPQIMEDLNKSKQFLEEVKAADPDKIQVNWAYPLERVDYILENIK